MHILVINSSAGGDESVSRELVDEVVTGFRAANLEATVRERDLASEPIPHLTTDTLKGVRGTPETEREIATRALSDDLVAELRAADIIVLGAPMYNFSVPSALKAWIDHIVRAGETFRYSETGPVGLLVGKKTIVIEASGGLYSEGPRQANDFQHPYLKVILDFIGLTDVRFVRAEKTAMGSEEREAAIARARAEVRGVTEDLPQLLAS